MKKVLLLLVALCMGVLVSCVPFSYDHCKSKMEKKDYKVTTSSLAAGIIKTVTGVTVDQYVVCSKTVEKDDKKVTYSVTAILFTSTDDAEKVFESFDDWASKVGAGDEVQCSGKWVFFGDEEAIKDFKALL